MAAAGSRRGDAKNGGAVGFRGVVGRLGGQGLADPAEIVPARVVLLSPRACQPGVGRAPPPSDRARDRCRAVALPVVISGFARGLREYVRGRSWQ